MNQKIFQVDNLHYHFRITYSKNKLYNLSFSDSKNNLIEKQLSLKISNNTTSKFAKEVQNQLNAYFQRRLKKFDIPIHIEGSEFSLKVFKEMSKIPYGKTKSYKQIAEKIKEPKSARAVGRVSGSNKIPIIIPCHRTVSYTHLTLPTT